MTIKCLWEHNGDDTLLYSTDFLGAYTRGETPQAAIEKMPKEIRSFALWSGLPCGERLDIAVTEEKTSALNIRDADSDAIFQCETAPLTAREYELLKALALKSAKDFLTLYNAVPDKNVSSLQPRKTFYGDVPLTAAEMYTHTKNVNTYYFGEIGVQCDNDGDILECRKRGFGLLEKQPDFLVKPPVQGSYDETWSVKKVLRRFIWHDRIHAKAMYRMALKTFNGQNIPNVFYLDGVS